MKGQQHKLKAVKKMGQAKKRLPTEEKCCLQEKTGYEKVHEVHLLAEAQGGQCHTLEVGKLDLLNT